MAASGRRSCASSTRWCDLSCCNASARHGMVVVPGDDRLSQPSSLFGDWFVPAPPKVLLELMQLGPHPVADIASKARGKKPDCRLADRARSRHQDRRRLRAGAVYQWLVAGITSP